MPLPIAASGSREEVYYCIEDGSGDISATTPNFVPIRFNEFDPSRNTAQVESNEVNPNRQRTKARQGTYSIEGNLLAELSFASHDYLMQAAFQSTWASQTTITGTTISAAASDNSLNDSGSGFISAGFQVGDLITVSGFTGDTGNNQSDLKITSVTAGKIIVSGGDALVDDSAGESVTIQTAGDYLIVGSTVPTVSILRRNVDIGVDRLYRHCRIGGMGLSVVLNRSAHLTFPAIGESVEEYTVPGGATFSTATTSDMMVPTLGYMHEAGTALTYLTDYNLEMTNNMEAQHSLFQRGAYSVRNGRFTAQGSMSAYFPDNTLLAKFIAETESNHIVRLQDLDGNWYRFICPDLVYTQDTDPTSDDTTKVHNLTFGPGFDGLTTVKIERSV